MVKPVGSAQWHSIIAPHPCPCCEHQAGRGALWCENVVSVAAHGCGRAWLCIAKPGFARVLVPCQGGDLGVCVRVCACMRVCMCMCMYMCRGFRGRRRRYLCACVWFKRQKVMVMVNCMMMMN